jgi:hypothetical protein
VDSTRLLPDYISGDASSRHPNQPIPVSSCTSRRGAMRFFDISDDLQFGAALLFVIALGTARANLVVLFGIDSQ